MQKTRPATRLPPGCIKTLEMIEGDMPARAVRMVKQWAKRYNNELIEMRKTQQYKQLPGLD